MVSPETAAGGAAWSALEPPGVPCHRLPPRLPRPRQPRSGSQASQAAARVFLAARWSFVSCGWLASKWRHGRAHASASCAGSRATSCHRRRYRLPKNAKTIGSCGSAAEDDVGREKQWSMSWRYCLDPLFTGGTSWTRESRHEARLAPLLDLCGNGQGTLSTGCTMSRMRSWHFA